MTSSSFILILILILVVWRRPWAITTLGHHGHVDNSVHLRLGITM